MALDTRHLRHLLAITEHGCFSRAAQALHVTQPALSRSIQTLEAALGSAVFERNRHGVEPTEMGRLVLRHARVIDASSRDLMRDVRLLQNLEQGELRLAVGSYGGAALIGPVLGRMHRLHPQLTLRADVAPWTELAGRLVAREVDIVVAELGAIDAPDGCETMALPTQSPVVVCWPGHPLLAQAKPTARHVFAFRWRRRGHRNTRCWRWPPRRIRAGVWMRSRRRRSASSATATPC